MPFISEEQLQKRQDEVTVGKALDAQDARGPLHAAKRTGHTPGVASQNGMYDEDGNYLDWFRVGDPISAVKPMV